MADSLEEKPVSQVSKLDNDAGDRALIEAVQNGDKFGVWDLGRELRDPDESE